MKDFNTLTLFYNSEMFKTLSHLALNIMGALFILLFGLWAARYLSHFLKNNLDNTKIDKTLITFLVVATRVFISVWIIIASLNTLGVSTTSLLAVLGTAGLAIALALKDSLNNVSAGIILLILRPFKVDDYVEAGGIGGTVQEINFFHTLLTTADNRTIAVPNAKLLDDKITNFSRNENRRIDLVIGISYDSNLEQAKKILQELIETDERILKEPAPVIAILDLAESSVNLAVRPWTQTAIYWDVRFDLLERIKKAFEENGISIPYPQREVHIKDKSK